MRHVGPGNVKHTPSNIMVQTTRAMLPRLFHFSVVMIFSLAFLVRRLFSLKELLLSVLSLIHLNSSLYSKNDK